MHRIAFGLSLFFLTVTLPWLSQAQQSATHNQNPVSQLQKLTIDITRNAATDSLKAYRIFRWLTNNISYDVATFTGAEDPYKKLGDGPEGYSQAQFDDWYDEQVSLMVLQRRKAICDGYARLFKALCSYAGLEAAYISGYGKTSDTIGKPFSANHAWNAIRLSGKWHLVDACWGSGYTTTNSSRFIRRYNGYYFCTPPEHFILDHYPEDKKWTLMASPPSLELFFRNPLFYSDYVSAGIASMTPLAGALQTKAGTVILFRITGRDTVFIPTIVEDSAGFPNPIFFPETKAGQEEPAALPTKIASSRHTSAFRRPPVSKQQRDAIDAIFNFVDTAATDADTALARTIVSGKGKETLNERMSSDVAMAGHPRSFDAVSIKGKVFEYRYKVPVKDVTLTFYNDSNPIVVYDIHVID